MRPLDCCDSFQIRLELELLPLARMRMRICSRCTRAHCLLLELCNELASCERARDCECELNNVATNIGACMRMRKGRVNDHEPTIGRANIN